MGKNNDFLFTGKKEQFYQSKNTLMFQQTNLEYDMDYLLIKDNFKKKKFTFLKFHITKKLSHYILACVCYMTFFFL